MCLSNLLKANMSRTMVLQGSWGQSQALLSCLEKVHRGSMQQLIQIIGKAGTDLVFGLEDISQK
jgi:hypothetical protein